MFTNAQNVVVNGGQFTSVVNRSKKKKKGTGTVLYIEDDRLYF